MSVTIRTRTAGRDPVARSHRRRAAFKTITVVVVVLAFVGGGTWLMFSSSVFAVTDVLITGVPSAIESELRTAVEDVLGQRALGFLRPARNIILLDTEAVTRSLMAGFENIESVTVRKEYPHALIISPLERTPFGSWCRGEDCQYFDRTGARWGSAVPSRGPLLLLVRDERPDEAWSGALFTGLMAAVGGLPELGLRAITVTLPDAAPGDARIRVSAGYDVLFGLLGDVEDQLSTLGVLVADRAAKPDFRPAYIDVRTPGRAYYR